VGAWRSGGALGRSGAGAAAAGVGAIGAIGAIGAVGAGCAAGRAPSRRKSSTLAAKSAFPSVLKNAPNANGILRKKDGGWRDGFELLIHCS
jgi:hypothetical protein